MLCLLEFYTSSSSLNIQWRSFRNSMASAAGLASCSKHICMFAVLGEILMMLHLRFLTSPSN